MAISPHVHVHGNYGDRSVMITVSLVSSDFIRTANVVALTDVSLLVVDKEWVGFVGVVYFSNDYPV